MNPANELGRPNLEEYYMSLAFAAASRANCLNRAVGSILVSSDNGSIVATGYNGVPKGKPHCITCRRREEGYGPGEGLHRSRSEHAERSVINQASKYGRKTENCILYVTDMPCSECCKGIIGAGIKKVYYCNEYPGSEARKDLEAVGIELIQLNKKKIIENLKNFLNLI